VRRNSLRQVFDRGRETVAPNLMRKIYADLQRKFHFGTDWFCECYWRLQVTKRLIIKMLDVSISVSRTGVPVYRCTGVPVYRCAGVPVVKFIRQRNKNSRIHKTNDCTVSARASFTGRIFSWPLPARKFCVIHSVPRAEALSSE
jgi:hypothetical protein